MFVYTRNVVNPIYRKFVSHFTICFDSSKIVSMLFFICFYSGSSRFVYRILLGVVCLFVYLYQSLSALHIRPVV